MYPVNRHIINVGAGPVPARTLAVAAILAITACSGDGDVVGDASKRCVLTLDAEVEQTVTRAAQTGVMDNTTLATTGFGVFIYGKNGTADLFATAQHVTYANGDTPSEPIDDVHLHPRKWNYGTQHDWTENETFSFYAYAPYASLPLSDPGTGITAIIADASGPTITYTVATDPAQSVDLLWGVKGDTGLPWLSQTRLSNGGLVLFNFRHALAAVGLHVQAMIDKDNDILDLTDEADPESLLGTDALKVTLQSITITPVNTYESDGITVKKAAQDFYGGGTLNLNNTTEANRPEWTPGDRSISSLTLSSSQINSSLTSSGSGVLKTADAQTVIAQSGGKDQFFMLLPDDAQSYEVTVEYIVRYKTGESTYKELKYISGELGARTATFTNLPLVAGIRYWLNLVIGLRTVSVSVTAEDWQGQSVDLELLTEQGTSANSSLSRRAAN